jgi:very-short-patch-repair endonuclease
MGNNPDRDRVRDEWVEGEAVKTLRLAAVDVLKDEEAVMRFILAECEARTRPDN